MWMRADWSSRVSSATLTYMRKRVAFMSEVEMEPPLVWESDFLNDLFIGHTMLRITVIWSICPERAAALEQELTMVMIIASNPTCSKGAIKWVCAVTLCGTIVVDHSLRPDISTHTEQPYQLGSGGLILLF